MSFQKIEKLFDGLKVLVADDYPVNQELCRGMLELMGCDVDVVGDGQAAVDAYIEGKYAVIFMDIMMPELDGFQATQAIREIEKTSGKHVFITAVTANALAGDKERCLAAGMDFYVSKPVKSAALAEALRAYSALEG